jgi:hypothetical protein
LVHASLLVSAHFILKNEFIKNILFRSICNNLQQYEAITSHGSTFSPFQSIESVTIYPILNTCLLLQLLLLFGVWKVSKSRIIETLGFDSRQGPKMLLFSITLNNQAFYPRHTGGFYFGVNQTWREVNYTPPSSAEVKKGGASLSPVHLRGFVLN